MFKVKQYSTFLSQSDAVNAAIDMATLQIIADEEKGAATAAVKTAGKLIPPSTNSAQIVKASILQLTSSVQELGVGLKFYASNLLSKLNTLRHAENTLLLIQSLHRE